MSGRGKKQEIVISYSDRFKVPSGGVVSRASWHGGLRGELDRIFAVSRGEEIIGLVVNEEGITAYFGKKDEFHTARQRVSTLTAERDALLARVNELDDEVARLVGERDVACDHLTRLCGIESGKTLAELCEAVDLEINCEYEQRTDAEHDRDTARSELERMRAVVEAARSWRKWQPDSAFAPAIADFDNPISRLVGAVDALDRRDTAIDRQTKGGDAHAPGGRPAPGHLQVAPPALDSTSAAGVGGAPLAATAMALELVAECWKEYMKGTNPYALEHVLRAKARELLEGK